MIAKNIKKLLISKGLNQKDLARLSELSYNTITNITSGKSQRIKPEIILKIAGALDISIDDLLACDDNGLYSKKQDQGTNASLKNIDVSKLKIEDLKKLILNLPDNCLSQKKKNIILSIIEM